MVVAEVKQVEIWMSISIWPDWGVGGGSHQSASGGQSVRKAMRFRGHGTGAECFAEEREENNWTKAIMTE